MIDILELEKKRLEWALKTFPEATALSSLLKLEEEVEEIRDDLEEGIVANPMEYADALMCLFDSAGRAMISPETIFHAFEQKLKINMQRRWKLNDDKTYSHIKEEKEEIDYSLNVGDTVYYTLKSEPRFLDDWYEAEILDLNFAHKAAAIKVKGWTKTTVTGIGSLSRKLKRKIVLGDKEPFVSSFNQMDDLKKYQGIPVVTFNDTKNGI